MQAFRSRRWLLAVLVAVLISAVACGDDGGGGGDDDGTASGVPDTITIGYQAIPNGDLVVKNEGWLEEAFPDTEIEWTLFDSGGSVNEAVVAGSIDGDLGTWEGLVDAASGELLAFEDRNHYAKVKKAKLGDNTCLARTSPSVRLSSS